MPKNKDIDFGIEKPKKKPAAKPRKPVSKTSAALKAKPSPKESLQTVIRSGVHQERKRLGRPTVYIPDMAVKVIQIMRNGGCKFEVCAELDLDLQTFNRWTNDPRMSEFRDAVKRGEMLCEAWWRKQGRENLTNPKFSSTLWYMNMKNRFGWTDRQVVEVDMVTVKRVQKRFDGAEIEE